MCILSSISDDEFRCIIKSSFYLKDVIVKCGYKASLSKRTRDKIKKRIYSLDLDTSHFKYPERKTIKQLCVVNGKYHRGGLKRRLIKENILKEICDSCGQLPMHNNKVLVLQLDHINGNNKDNRIENLRLLCPNCHSQTETFSGKNIKKPD
jgi:hypothetical protein